MHTTFMIFTILVIIIHLFIMILEMFLWTRPYGMKAFRMSFEKAKETKILAMNQGLYNGMIAAGLIYCLLYENLEMRLFLLSSVVILGLFGGFTVHKKIIIIQALPAMLGLIAYFYSA